MAAKTVTLILDEESARRLEDFAARRGLDEASALDLALRAGLEAEDKADAAAQAVIDAARAGEDGAAFAIHHDDIRRWLLSWGTEAERKRPRSC